MPSEKEELDLIIEKLRNGTLTPEAAATQLYQYSNTASTPNAGKDYTLDLDRETRTGIPEVIFAAGKSNEQLKNIITTLIHSNKKNILLTRVSPNCYETLKPLETTLNIEWTYHAVGQILYTKTFTADQLSKHPLRSKFAVSVITAGSSDLNTAEEAALTLECMGTNVKRIYDVGVAGIHRLLKRLTELRQTPVVIVIAGMDGVLPSVCGGLIDRPIIAVPTSVGYGANFGGVAPLLTMLNSCAPGVTTVNIDNGFGAAIVALKMFHAFKES